MPTANEESGRDLVIVCRSAGLDRRANVIVAEVTRVIRDLPGEVPLHVADGMPVDCVVNTDNLHTIPKDRLRERITVIPEDRLFALAQALRHSLDLDW